MEDGWNRWRMNEVGVQGFSCQQAGEALSSIGFPDSGGLLMGTEVYRDCSGTECAMCSWGNKNIVGQVSLNVC